MTSTLSHDFPIIQRIVHELGEQVNTIPPLPEGATKDEMALRGKYIMGLTMMGMGFGDMAIGARTNEDARMSAGLQQTGDARRWLNEVDSVLR
jgi:hypothetical protein